MHGTWKKAEWRFLCRIERLKQCSWIGKFRNHVAGIASPADDKKEGLMRAVNHFPERKPLLMPTRIIMELAVGDPVTQLV